MVDVSFSNALAAYNAASKMKPEASSVADKPNASGTFADMVKNVVEDTVEANRASEKLSMQAIAGEADLREVVAAVSNAEMALETVVTIRDKVTAAYQEILRMPI
ncbi:MAG: flagellar hook-basal body complex protein FliE [Alphaproteobacteria bacterium]